MEYGIRLEKTIRTARDRLEQWVGTGNRETCLGIYLLDEILDSVETATAAERGSFLRFVYKDLVTPPFLPAPLLEAAL